jgi:hypothetical protein
VSYQTAIPDDFKPPQYRDEKFEKQLALYQAKHRPQGPWVVAIPRPELDPSSRVQYDMGAAITYELGKVDQVAVMHVIGVAKGRVRLGYREQIPVAVGDLVLVNLREAGHWVYIGGVLTYWFTADVAMMRMYRTDKPLEPPRDKEARLVWNAALFWNVKDVLNDYVLLGRDPKAERYMRNGPETLLHIPGNAQTDGTRSDNMRDNRFPIVYRRVLGVGPGRVMRRESDLGIIEREETKSEAQPGDMMCYAKTVRAAAFTFQGMPLEVIHCASTLDIELGNATAMAIQAQGCEVHESCATPIPWDVESEIDADEEDQLRGKL